MIDELQKKVDDIEAQIKAVDAQMKPLQAKRTRLFDQRDKALNALGQAKLDLMTEPDFKLLLDRSVHQSGPVYDRARKVFESMGFDATGYWTDTMQAALKFGLKHDAPVDDMAAAIRKIVPAMKVRRFSVTSNDLSASGILHLEVDDDGVGARLTKTTYARESKLFDGKLEAVLQHIAHHYWYGEPHHDREDDWR